MSTSALFLPGRLLRNTTHPPQHLKHGRSRPEAAPSQQLLARQPSQTQQRPLRNILHALTQRQRRLEQVATRMAVLDPRARSLAVDDRVPGRPEGAVRSEEAREEAGEDHPRIETRSTGQEQSQGGPARRTEAVAGEDGGRAGDTEVSASDGRAAGDATSAFWTASAAAAGNNGVAGADADCEWR